MSPIEINHSETACSSKSTTDLAGGHDEAPNFSMRDYAFKFRSKDIRNSWPFAEQLLQLCLDNGISNLLPPFEPSKIVRSHCFTRDVESEYLPSCTINKQISEINGEPKEVIAPDQSFMSSEHTQVKVHQGDTPNIGDHMAIKICPVCKLFTSSSNTTLNAHIDGCLSSGWSIATMDGQCLKPKIKPRKIRLMVDIYTTAPRCTLEELDRRYGTNWAANSSHVAPTNDTNLGTNKSTKILVSDTVNRGDVGDIYVDSNGMKILILSASDDSPPSTSRKNLKLKKNGQGFKSSSSKCLIAEKKSLKLKYLEVGKDDTQKKKLRIAKGFNDEIEAPNEADPHEKKEESLSQLLSAPEQVKGSEPTMLGHWACSKRTDVSRKYGSKVDPRRGTEKMVEKAGRNHALISPETKGLDVLLDVDRDTNSAEKSSTQPSNSNPKLLMKGDLTLVSGRMGVSSCSESHPSLNTRKSLFPKSESVSFAARKFTNEKLVTFKKFQKRRSVSRCSKWQGGEKYFDFGFVTPRANEVNKNHRSDFSKHREERSSGTVNIAADYASNLDLDPIPEEHEERVSRNENHFESPSQRSEHNQEIGNEITSQESRENSLAISEVAQSNQDCSMIVDVGSSGSPLSPASAVSSLSIEDNKLPESGKLRSRILRKDDKMKMSMKESSCSCSESLSGESQITNHIRKKMASNLFVKTLAVSSFHAGPNMESPTESVVTMASSKSSIDSSDPSSWPMTRAASHPVLRLMGKDLVVNKEDNPKIFPCGPNYTSTERFPNYYHYQRKSNIIDRMVAPHQHWQKPADSSYLAQHMVVINDKLQDLDSTYLPRTIQRVNLMDSQKPFSCLPPQNPCANSEGTSFVIPSPSSSYFSSTQR